MSSGSWPAATPRFSGLCSLLVTWRRVQGWGSAGKARPLPNGRRGRGRRLRTGDPATPAARLCRGAMSASPMTSFCLLFRRGKRRCPPGMRANQGSAVASGYRALLQKLHAASRCAAERRAGVEAPLAGCAGRRAAQRRAASPRPSARRHPSRREAARPRRAQREGEGKSPPPFSPPPFSRRPPGAPLSAASGDKKVRI